MITKLTPIKTKFFCFHWRYPFFWKEYMVSYKIQKFENGEWKDV